MTVLNKRAKGARRERQVVKILEEKGYECVRPNFSRYGYTDFFNLWDIIAVSDKDIRFVQVKSNKSHTYGKALNKHREWKCPPNSIKECWLIEDRKEPVVIPL